MFTKIIIGLVILLLAFGAYSFYFSQGGGNRPITIEGTLQGKDPLTGKSVIQDYRINITPSKVSFNSKTPEKVNFSLILRFDKKKIYLVNNDKKKYSVLEFKYIGKDKVKDWEETDLTWWKSFDATIDGANIGTDSEKFFCKKFTLKKAPLNVNVWFTRQTKFGRAYIRALNNLARVEIINAPEKFKNIFDFGDRKFRGKDLEFFPIPLKADMRISMPGMKTGAIWEAKIISRDKIEKDVFEVPETYEEIDVSEMVQELDSITPSMMGQPQHRQQPRSGSR